MPIHFSCPTCGQTLNVSDAAAGRSGKCPHCKGAILVPQAALPSAIAPGPLRPALASGPPLAAMAAAPARPALTVRLDQFLKQHAPWSYAAAAGVGLAAILIPFLLLTWLLSGSSELVRATRYYPDQTNLVVSVNIRDMLASKLYQDLKKEVPEVAQFEKEASGSGKRSLHDIASIYFALNLEKVEREGFVGVVFYRRSGTLLFDPKEYPRTSKFGRYTIHEGADMAVCQAEGSVEVGSFGSTSALLKTVLQRDKPPTLGPGLQALQEAVNRSRTLTVVLSWKDASAQFRNNLAGMAAQGGANLPLDDVEGLTTEIQFGSADLAIEGAIHCKDAKKAEDIKKAAEGIIALVKLTADKDVPREALDVLSAIQWEHSGSQTRFRVKITKDQIARMFRAGR